MASTFTLDLENPAITQSPKNVINTDVQGGNQLNLIVTNNYGFDFQFGGDSNTNQLSVKISDNIIDSANLAQITAASPWKVSDTTVSESNDGADSPGYCILKLVPEQTISFKDGEAVTIGLADVNPTTKGTGTVFTEYDFGGVTMDPTDQLSVLGSSKPDNKPLIGNNNALRYTLKVNDGPDTNPIIVTGQPVTADNAAENKLHLNFNFQDQNMPTNGNGVSTLGNLVSGWDINNPPTFRVQFPYFNAQSQFPAPLDLTDDIKQGEANYNPYTSAWNIKLSFDPNDPSVVTNDWWTIKLDPLATSPSWIIQPTSANKYLFTGTTSGPTGSGLFLDLFFSHVYSALIPDPTRPETLIILETYDFPGFNDKVLQQPLFKEASVQISCFTGKVNFLGDGTAQLVFDWNTKNASKCYITGDSGELRANAGDCSGDGSNHSEEVNDTSPYTREVSLAKPLLSSYTLEAIGKNNVSKIKKTINLQWKESTSGPISAEISTPTGMDIAPDGSKVFVTCSSDQKMPPQLISLVSTSLVKNDSETINLPNKTPAKNVKATDDGSKLFLAGLAPSGATGYLYGYTTGAPPSELPGSPAEPGSNDAPELFPIAVSSDNQQVVVSAARAPTSPFIASYNTSDLKATTGSPLTGGKNQPLGLAIVGDNIYYPTSEGLAVLDRTTLQPTAHSPISLKSDDNISYIPGMLAASPDDKTITTLAYGYSGEDRVFILCQVDLTKMALKKRVQVPNGYGNSFWTPTTNLIYSYDGKYIFVFGVDYAGTTPDTTSTLFSIYDAATLQEVSWSPLPVTKFYVDMVMAPDGSRVHVSTLDSGTKTTGKVIQLKPYFE